MKKKIGAGLSHGFHGCYIKRYGKRYIEFGARVGVSWNRLGDRSGCVCPSCFWSWSSIRLFGQVFYESRRSLDFIKFSRSLKFRGINSMKPLAHLPNYPCSSITKGVNLRLRTVWIWLYFFFFRNSLFLMNSSLFAYSLQDDIFLECIIQ